VKIKEGERRVKSAEMEAEKEKSKLLKEKQ
jgi:hypothetical protein